jgi:hypothetical protein
VVASRFGITAPYWVGFVVAVGVSAATWRVFSRGTVAAAYADPVPTSPAGLRDRNRRTRSAAAGARASRRIGIRCSTLPVALGEDPCLECELRPVRRGAAPGQ